ncbi:phage GP46 family protein [Luteibacter aegosomatis]|uniref:phage GP46 family protein n=1 Tax=Luteibacter aegosomatis TaxID=2911537 RepID=UPI001FFA99F9|nr:phage GP46 family protein [Luteibacter aegosomatis]UPG86862.1 phage GP46 family protein [Luteibacter aegosomatis]
MTDISTVWNVERGEGEWVLSGASLASGDDLVTSTLICLFTDRVAEDSDVIPDGTEDRRGWWGDAGEDRPIGSRLWLLDRSKLTNAVATRARGYAKEALQWLVDDDVAVAVTVSSTIVKPSTLRLAVTVDRSNGTKQAVAFDWAWLPT